MAQSTWSSPGGPGMKVALLQRPVLRAKPPTRLMAGVAAGWGLCWDRLVPSLHLQGKTCRRLGEEDPRAWSKKKLLDSGGSTKARSAGTCPRPPLWLSQSWFLRPRLSRGWAGRTPSEGQSRTGVSAQRWACGCGAAPAQWAGAPVEPGSGPYTASNGWGAAQDRGGWASGLRPPPLLSPCSSRPAAKRLMVLNVLPSLPVPNLFQAGGRG